MSGPDGSGCGAPGWPLSLRRVGDPVDVVTGALLDDDTDFRLPGAAFPLSFVRHYDSRRAGEDRGAGRGFRHSLDLELRLGVDGLTFVDARWQETTFPFLSRDGEEAVREGIVLARRSETSFEVRPPTGPSCRFEIGDWRSGARLAALEQGGRLVSLHADADGRLVRVDAGERHELAFEHGEGHLASVMLVDGGAGTRTALVRYTYDPQGRLVEGTDAYGNRFAYGYDPAHRTACKKDRRGYSFLFAFDGRGRCVSSRGEDGAEAVSLEYRPDERLTVVTRGDGGAWRYHYDANGTIVQIVDPYGGARAFVLDGEGRVGVEIDPLGNVTRIAYDARGTPIARIDPLGHVLPLPERPDAPHPLDHWVGSSPLEWEWGTAVEVPDAMPASRALDARFGWARPALTAVDHPSGGRPVVVRDILGLPKREERHDGKVRRWGFDPNANVRLYTDFDGRTTRWEHRSWNFESAEIDPLERTIRSEHSFSEQLTSITDGGGARSEYAYDLKDRLVEVRRHGKVRESYVYDAADNVVEKRGARGQPLVRYAIGPGNLDVGLGLASGGTQSLKRDERGRIVEAKAGSHTCTFAYDADGLRIADQRDGLGVEHEIVAGELVETTALGRFATAYELDLEASPGPARVVRDPTGREHRIATPHPGLVERSLAGGLTELAQYDLDGRCLAKIALRAGAEASWTRRFRYSGEGDLVEREDGERGTTVYEHDAAHRLQKARLPDGSEQRYRYDDGDNLLEAPGLSATYRDGNLLSFANGERFEHDERDHVAFRHRPDRTIAYRHDELDQLVAIEAPGLEWKAEYDALGRRTRKVVGGAEWTYYWDGDRLAAELFPDGRARVYVYPDGRAIVPLLFVDYASVDADPASGERRYVLCDHLGAPERIEDDAGRILWRARLDPYGTAHVEIGEGFHQPIRFPGHLHDEETGLHYNRFRYYSPELGRYLESDPNGIEGGLNLYAYTANPLREVDVRGLKPRCPNGKDCPLRRRGAQKRKSESSGKPPFSPPRATPPPHPGGKTSGVLHVPGRAPVPLISGVKGPSEAVRGKGLPGFNGNQLMHVEGHAAAFMRTNGVQEAVLDISKVPCRKGAGGGCNGLLPRMLPPGSTLRVRGPGGYDTVFTGTG